VKRLILIASLGIVGILMAPIASASAESATGKCHIEGTATFSPSLKMTEEVESEYSFTSSGGSCTSTPATKFIKATVKGKGKISCLFGASLEAGVGVLEVEFTATGKVEKHEFKFTFTASGGVVNFTATGEVEATGTANFFKDSSAATECAKGTAKSLKFEADAEGKI
jgi:hypothetical protein